MNSSKRYVLAIIAAIIISLPFMAQRPSDSETLGMALEYFQSGKYHEALLLFEKLDKEYALNPRYHAYMGICCYYEWQYEDACKYLDEAIPQLEAFAPHERSVYYFADGESHFQLQQYSDAIPYFEKALTVCYENEKGDIHYRLGLCYMFAEDWQNARDHYRAALDNYVTFRNTPEMRARIYQTSHMMKGCESHLKKPTEIVNELADTIAQPQDSLPTIMVDVTPAPKDVDSTKNTNSRVALNMDAQKAPIHKDTIHNEIPRTINIQDLFNHQVEVKE